MQEIERQLRIVRRRLNATTFIRAWVLSLSLGLGLGCLAFAVPRIWSVEFLQSTEQVWRWQGLWSGSAIAASLLAAAVFGYWRRQSNAAAAIELDQRFGLKDRVSSALGLSSDALSSPIGQSLLHDASTNVARVDVRDQFPISFHWRWLAPIIPASLMVGLMFLPLAEKPEASETTTVSNEKEVIEVNLEQAKKSIEAATKILSEKGLEKAAEDLQSLSKQLDDLDTGSEDLKKEALVKLNDLKQQLNDEKQKLGNFEGLKNELSRLKDVAPGPAKEMANALKEGDFEQAKKVLQDLATKLKENKLTEEEQRKLADNFGELAKAVEQMAQEHEQQIQDLKEQIKRAVEEGDPQKAAELQEKLEQKESQNQQMEKMKQVAERLQKSSDALKKAQSGEPNKGEPKPGEPKPSSANPAGQPQKSDEKNASKDSESNAEKAKQDAQQAIEDLMQQMEDIAADEDAMEALKDLEDELQDCKDGMNQCEGEGEEFKDKRNQNDFAKGSGRGHGKRDFEENDTGTYKSRVAAKLQKGQTIVTGDADGENATTGSIAEAREAVEASLKREADPMEDQQLPRAQREHAKQYFEKFRTGGK